MAAAVNNHVATNRCSIVIDRWEAMAGWNHRAGSLVSYVAPERHGNTHGSSGVTIEPMVNLGGLIFC